MSDSPLFRLFGGMRELVSGASEVKRAIDGSRCLNCPAEIPPAPLGETRPRLCDGCGEKAAAAGARLLGEVVQGGMNGVLQELFSGRGRPR